MTSEFDLRIRICGSPPRRGEGRGGDGGGAVHRGGCAEWFRVGGLGVVVVGIMLITQLLKNFQDINYIYSGAIYEVFFK